MAALWPASPLRFAVWRRRLLAGFIAVHSIHFATVLTLAAVTAGANVMERGGWVFHIGVGLLFYGAVIKLWQQEKRRLAGQVSSPGTRRFLVLVIIIIWLVFVQAYALRLALSGLFVVMSLLLIAGLAVYLFPMLRLRRG